MWKPVSEDDGNLVILLPPNLTGNVAGVVVSRGGSVIAPGRATGVHNGGREHFRFPSPGAAYGSGLTVIARLKSGGTKSWSVPSGAQRVG